MIPGNGAFMLERTDDDSAPVIADLIYSGGLGNGGEIITLTDAVSNVIDVIGTVAGWPAGDNNTKATMERIDLDAAGTDAGNWQDGIVEGSPTNSILDKDADMFGYSPNFDWSAGTGAGFEGFEEDCDDARDDTYPDAPELLDVYDNDCDIEIDEDFILGELPYKLYFNSAETLYALNTTTETNAMEEALLERIHGATTTIEAAIYGFNRVSLRDALIAAHNRGVTVRLVADYGEYHDLLLTGGADAGFNMVHTTAAGIEAAGRAGRRSSDHFALLEAAGIAVQPSNYVSYLQHNKFAIFDGEVVWTGSTNWTDTGFTANANNSIVLTSTHVATAYGMEFDEMFNGEFATAKENDTPHTFNFTNGTVEIWFSPSDDVESKIIDVFNAAESEMAFSMFFWTSDPLGDLAVTRYVTDSIDIFGVWDAVGARNAYSEDEKMCDAGIPIKIEVAGGKSHNKMAVFDAYGANPVVVTGSYNWTAAGTESNDENTLILKGFTDIAQTYYEEILYLYGELPNETICANISPESGLAACSNGRDDDFDGLIDTNDPNCQESTVAACTDGQDNDADGDIDMEDLDCFLLPSVPTAVTVGHLHTTKTESAVIALILIAGVCTGCVLYGKRRNRLSVHSVEVWT